MMVLQLNNEPFTAGHVLMLVKAKTAVPVTGAIMDTSREVQVILPKVPSVPTVNGRVWFAMSFVDSKGQVNPLVTYRVTL